jgi:hypothetical protein
MAVGFPVNVPILAVCGVVVRRTVPPDGARRDGSMDPFGQVLVIGVCGGVFAAMSAAGIGMTAAGIGCAVVCIAVLLVRAPRPGRILDRVYFANLPTVAVTFVPVAFSLCFWCLLIVVPDRLGAASGATPMRAALTVLPLTVGLVVAALIPTSHARHDFRLSFIVGFAGLAVGATLAAAIHTTPALTTGMLVMGFAAGYMNPDVARSAIALAAPDRAGMAAGLTSTMRQMGFGAGVLVLGRSGIGSAFAAEALSPVFTVAAGIAGTAMVLVLSASALSRVKGYSSRPDQSVHADH